jgi:hypothetical protein
MTMHTNISRDRLKSSVPAIARSEITGVWDKAESVPSTWPPCRVLKRVRQGPVAAGAVASLIAIWVVSSSGGAFGQGLWVHYSDPVARISYELPYQWQVQGEQDLEKENYLSAPSATYVLIAGAEPASLDGVANPPSVYAFSETPRPWFMVLVEPLTGRALAPKDAYRLAVAGEVVLQEEQGLDPIVVGLTKPADVSSGGLDGSQARTEIIVPGAGDIELNEIVYTESKTAWITMVGCTVACYNDNAGTLAAIINDVNVGTAWRSMGTIRGAPSPPLPRSPPSSEPATLSISAL